MSELQHKRKARRKQTAEDFTPKELVLEMLDKLPEEVWTDPNKTFLDPSGGDGAFLIEILKRKISYGHEPLQALKTIFTVELMDDNVEECKQRLLELIDPSLHTEAKQILDHNIVCHNALTWDFENWRSKIKKAKELF